MARRPPWLRTSFSRWALAASLLAVALLGAWALAHRLPWRGRTAPLWSEQDLPPLPAERENGWVLFHEAGAAAKLDDHARSRDLRDGLEQIEWDGVRALADRLREFTADPIVRSHVDAARAALALPRFADACPLDVEVRCHERDLERLHDVVALGALADALAGRWGEALSTARSLLRADLATMRTSRTWISALTAHAMVRRDLRCLRVLLDGLEREPGRLAHHRADVVGIAELLEPAPASGPAAARAVMAEYVYVTRALWRVSEHAASDVEGYWTMALLMDAERTRALVDSYFAALMRFAESPSTREPPILPRSSRERFGWWAHNAVGKLLLDTVLLDLAPVLREMERWDAEPAVTSEALRKRARTAGLE